MTAENLEPETEIPTGFHLSDQGDGLKIDYALQTRLTGMIALTVGLGFCVAFAVVFGRDPSKLRAMAEGNFMMKGGLVVIFVLPPMAILAGLWHAFGCVRMTMQPDVLHFQKRVLGLRRSTVIPASKMRKLVQKEIIDSESQAISGWSLTLHGTPTRTLLSAQPLESSDWLAKHLVAAYGLDYFPSKYRFPTVRLSKQHLKAVKEREASSKDC